MAGQFVSVSTGLRHYIERQDYRENPDRHSRMSTSKKIKIKIKLGQQINPLSHLSKITPLLLVSIFLLSLSMYHSWNDSICSKCIPQSYTAESNSPPFPRELDFHLLNLLQGLFRNVSFTLRREWL